MPILASLLEMAAPTPERLVKGMASRSSMLIAH